MDLSAILPLLAQNIQNSQNNQKSFGDMLRDRRAFTQSAENGVGDQVQRDEQNGMNGVPISPAAADSPMLNYHTDNANKTAALTQQMFGYGEQANQGLSTLASLLGTMGNQSLEKRGQDLQYGLDPSEQAAGPDGKMIAGPQAISEVTKQGGSDLISQAPDEISKRLLAIQILTAGGVGAYRKANPNNISPQDAEMLGNTNDTLSKVARIKDRINNSKALHDYLGNAPVQAWANLLNHLGGNTGEHAIGFKPEDIAALNDLNVLNASGDKAIIGGKIDNYLANKFGGSNVGKDKKAEDNLAILNNIEQGLTTRVNAYAKNKGYNNASDIPGLDYFNKTMRVKIGNQTGTINASEYDPKTMQKL